MGGGQARKPELIDTDDTSPPLYLARVAFKKNKLRK